MLPFIEIIAGRVNNFRKNKNLRKEKTHRSEYSPLVEEHTDFANRKRRTLQYSLYETDNREVIENYEELSNAVDAMNIVLSEKGSEYRYLMEKSGEEIFFSIIKIKEDGRNKLLNKKNITRDKFSKWIRNIEMEEGFFVDESD